MKMNILKHIAKAFFVTLLVIMIAPGCKKSADLSTDPLVRDTLFTFTPSHGYAGSTVVIQGSGLNDVTAVSFGVKAGTIVSKSDAEISVTIPVGAVTAKVTLVKPSTVLTSFTNFVIDATPIPTITKFTPAIAGSGDTVTLTGNLLDKADSVFIGTLKATVLTGKTATSMRIKLPLGMTTNKINMYYDYMTSYGMKKVAISASDNPLTLALPSITSFDANIGALNVTQLLVVKGKMLSEVTSVTFVNRVAGYTASDTIKTATYVASGDTMLTVTVPAGATYGVIKFKILDGTVTSGAYAVNLPTITSFKPQKEAVKTVPRLFSVNGTRFDLVTSVKVGNTIATIDAGASSSTLLVFSVPGNTGGFISLIAPNGTVKSATPFILPGDAWLADYNTIYDPVRLYSEELYPGYGSTESFQDVDGTPVKSLGNDAQHGNFRRWNVTFKTVAASPRIYIRGDQGAAANPAPDRFLLYTSSSVGVTFSFDISWDVIPAGMVNANGMVDLKIMFFNADQGAGGGYGYYTDHIMVPYTAAGAWQTVVVNTNATRVANDTYMYNTLFPAASSQKFAPNNCRIITLMFQGAYGIPGVAPAPATPNPAASGQQMIVNLDNVKFTIN